MNKNRGVKHLSYSELLKRKEEGRCFRCGEAYNPLHRCLEGSLRIMLLEDDKEETPGEGNFKEKGEGQSKGKEGILQWMELSLYSVGGSYATKDHEREWGNCKFSSSGNDQ